MVKGSNCKPPQGFEGPSEKYQCYDLDQDGNHDAIEVYNQRGELQCSMSLNERIGKGFVKWLKNPYQEFLGLPSHWKKFFLSSSDVKINAGSMTTEDLSKVNKEVQANLDLFDIESSSNGLQYLRTQRPAFVRCVLAIAKKLGLPAELLFATLYVESRFNIRALDTTSCDHTKDKSDGARGLGQIKQCNADKGKKALRKWDLIWEDRTLRQQYRELTNISLLGPPPGPGVKAFADIMATAYEIKRLANYLGVDLANKRLQPDSLLVRKGYSNNMGWDKLAVILRAAYHGGEFYALKPEVVQSLNSKGFHEIKFQVVADTKDSSRFNIEWNFPDCYSADARNYFKFFMLVAKFEKEIKLFGV